MESRTPPKFVPTLTEVAAQDAALQSDEKIPLVTDQQAPGAIESIAIPVSTGAGLDRLRRPREAEAQEAAADAPSDLDIANLPTQSGWAQLADSAALPVGDAHAVPVLMDYVVDTEAVCIDATAMPGADAAATWVEGQVEGQAAETPVATASVAPPDHPDAATASLVASAAQAAQELEDAITRRVLKRVQETLDAELSRAVLQVVEQQTALLQSSLELEVDRTIRVAVTKAVAQVLHPERGTD